MTNAATNDKSEMHATLAARLTRAPKLVDSRNARRRLADLLATPEARGLESLVAQEQARALLEGVADHSSYLWRLAESDAERLARLLGAAPEASLARVLETLRRDGVVLDDEASLMRALRRAKQEAALLIALADIGGVWDVVEVTRAISNFADAAISSALSFLLRREAEADRLNLQDAKDPERACGVVVLALGKHGAQELNYSSDVDLIVLYDRLSPALPRDAEPARLFVRMTQALVRLLQERTGDGYVLRVDLRLRPDPGTTAIAISTDGARDYYETLGQNWERAAMIKARAVAGDIALGREFLAELAPFIWRKYFDYAAIADIHAMKRQIHAVRGHAEIAVAGHDVKLGRGGIREIEFFAQTQQLVFGGKRPALRGSRTLDMLDELVREGWAKPAAARDLAAAYKFLREVEHRLQMIADEQTQRLPSDEEALKRFARFCGFVGVKSFGARLTRHMRNVERHYARLFESAPGLDAAHGSLVFTGVTDDPDTIETLRKMGFVDPARAAETVRGWHFGRRAAVQSARAREVLTELVPGLLEAFSGSGDPDAALATFDAALTRMPAAIELMSILLSSKPLRELFADVLGGAPRLAEVVARAPHVLDAAIDPTLSAPGRAYSDRARHVLESSGSYEEFLDGLRDFARDEKFLVGLRTLSQAIDPSRAARAYSDLADAILEATLERVTRDFQRDHGACPGGRSVVVGLGKLGSREMTAASDLDLLLIYDFDDARSESAGPRALHAVQYYTRLTQRLVSALTVATRRGELYEVDMRLRPTGNKGPLATQFRAFVEYQTSEAEIWEQMALTRARVVCGDASLAGEVQRAIAAALSRPRDESVLKSEARDMRRLIAQEKGEENPWDLKLASGGLIDIEFIAQYLVLRHAGSHPKMFEASTARAIATAGELGLVARRDADRLVEAHALYGAVTQMLRLSIHGSFDPKAAAPGVLRRIASVAGFPDFRALGREIAGTRKSVRAIFERLLA